MPQALFEIFQPAGRLTYLYVVGLYSSNGRFVPLLSHNQVFPPIHHKGTHCDKITMKILKFLSKMRFFNLMFFLNVYAELYITNCSLFTVSSTCFYNYVRLSIYISIHFTKPCSFLTFCLDRIYK